MDETIRVIGLQQLQANMEALPLKFARKGLRSALRAGGTVIKKGMRALAPRDTGFLEQHFGVKTKLVRGELAGMAFIGPQGRIDYPDEGGGYHEKIGSKGGRIKKVGRIPVATVARFLEFGTAKMGKRPFMTQAFESNKGAALDAMVEKLREATKC